MSQRVSSGATPAGGSPFIADLNWADVAKRMHAGALALLPIGAGAKQHGWHLPMSTDQIQAEWLARIISQQQAERGQDMLVWPSLSYGYYPAFTQYAGSISISAGLFVALVREITSQIHGFGARHVFVLDTGISTIPPVAEALSGCDWAYHLRIHAGPRYRATTADLAEQAYGSHADEMETSRMRVIAPEVVEMTKATASPFRVDGPRPGPLEPFDPAAANYSPSGSFGDPTLASVAKGEALIAAMLADIDEAMAGHIANPKPA